LLLGETAMEILLSILGTLITTASLVYAIKTNREKQRFERLVRDKLAGIAGNVWHSQVSADLSDRNFTKARDAAHELEESEKKQKVLKHIHNGARDAVAAKRMLSNLLCEVLSMQKGMFDTEKILHPEMAKNQMQSDEQTENS
jgi:kynureninase